MQVDPRRLAVLLAVHRGGGVLPAARALHVTPSAVSQQMARLEVEVGHPVLDRQPGGAVLTAVGAVLAETAENIETELHELQRSLAVMAGALSGTVTVGAPQSVVRAVLVSLVADLVERHPGLTLELRQAEGPDGAALLRTGALDVLLLESDSPVGRTRPRGTRDLPVLDEPWLVLTPADAPAPASLEDLSSATWLVADASAAAHGATERVLDSFSARPPTAHRYDDYNVALAMVAAGLGTALVPRLALAGARVEGVRASALPGVGTRGLVARRRTTGAGSRREVTSVLQEVVRAATSAGGDQSLPHP